MAHLSSTNGSAPEDLAPEDLAPEDLAQEDLAQEDLAQEDLAQEDLAQEDLAPERRDESHSLSVSNYDRVSTGVVALNLIIGVAVILMFLMWATFRHVNENVYRLPTDTWDEGREEPAKGYDQMPEEPGKEEADDMVDPQLTESMDALTDTLSQIAAHLNTIDTDAAIDGRGEKLGDNRYKRTKKGPPGGPVQPRWERWRISMEAASATRFGALLDEMGIHIGAFGGGDPKIYYVHSFSKTPKRYERRGGKSEKRIFFAPGDKTAKLFTTTLAKRNGVPIDQKTLVHFYPPQLEKKLETAERAYSKGRKLSEIRRTYFRVKRTGGGLQFIVTKQEYKTTTP